MNYATTTDTGHLVNDLAKREKRRVAFHEAGHAAVCSHFGGAGMAEIWQNTAQNVEAGETAWLGHFRMFAEPGLQVWDEQTRQLLGIVPPPPNWRVLLGLAGSVAEYMADGITDGYEIADGISMSISAHEISKTDLDAMGAAWWVLDVDAVVQILLHRWPTFERDVVALLSRES